MKQSMASFGGEGETEYEYEPLFGRIADLTKRADSIVSDPPDDIRRATNQLISDVVGFCREHPEFRYALPPFAKDSKWNTEWEKFVALLGIAREVAQQARDTIKSSFGLDSHRSLSERGILQGLLTQFGTPMRPENIEVDEKYLMASGAKPALPQRLAELRDLRIALAPHNLQVGVSVKNETWFDPHFDITSAAVSLESYRPNDSDKLPQINPLAQTAARPPRRDLPPREIERARLARDEALQRALRQEENAHAEAWVPNRDKLLEAIDNIDTFTEDQLEELSAACARFTRRIALTFRRATGLTWIPEHMAQTLEELLSSVPRRITGLAAWEVIRERLTEMHLICDYVTAGYHDPDELSNAAYGRLTKLLPEKVRPRYEISLNAQRATHHGNGHGEGNDESEMDLTELMGRNLTPDDDYEGITETMRTEWSYEDLGEISFSRDRSSQERRPRLPTKLLNHQAQGWAQGGGLTQEIERAIRHTGLDGQSKAALQLFLLHLLQKLAQCQITDWKNPVRMPLIPGKPTVDFARLCDAVGDGKLPKEIWRQQTEAMTAVKRGMERGKSKMYICAPPGTGKTRTAILLMQNLNPNGRTLILVPTIQLIGQTISAIKKYSKFRDIGRVGGGRAEFDRKVTIATYTSFQKAALEGNFHPSEFGLVIMDEAHRSLSDLRSRIADAFREAIVVGMTASDKDIKGQSVGREFDCVYRLQAADGMRADIVNPTKLWRDPCSDNMTQKAREIERIHSHRLKGEQTLVVLDTVERLEFAAKFLRDTGIDARCVHSQMNPKEADANDEGFRAGEFPVLFVCDMLLEGWDHPSLRHIIMGDIRTATWQFQQATGRNGRKLPGKGYSTLSILEEVDNPEPVTRVLQKAFGTDTSAHANGELIVTPDGQWPDNTILA